ncbi:hypothetical protein ABXK61_22135, partial [Burkholderia sola]|uniref:hypothetical protein n=1 Tax=Burkholderia TaxID=32008 RepID=UPI001AE6D1C5
DLAVRESRLLHSVELPQRENSTSDPTGSAGGLPKQVRVASLASSFPNILNFLQVPMLVGFS